MASVFDRVAQLLGERAKIVNAIAHDKAVYERIPRTIKKREGQVAEIDVQLADLKKQIEGNGNQSSSTTSSSQEGKTTKK